MAMPIMDEQLSRIVLDGMWKKKPVRVNLGTLMLDNNVVRFDRQSYNEMEKNEKVDMAQCEIAWGKKIALEIKKREMEKQANEGKAKRRKTNFLTHLDFWEKEDEKETINNMELKPDEAVSGYAISTVAKAPAVEEASEECYHCREEPCVWVAQKEAMKRFDASEHAHLPVGDLPPNNIRRKKVYRQMFLHINQGPAGVGVRIELPKCVENGTREMFPSPTFMGFKIR